MTKTRHVFGRLRYKINGAVYTLELRKDGLFVRQFRRKRQYVVPLDHVIRLTGIQTELFTQSAMVGEVEKPAVCVIGKG